MYQECYSPPGEAFVEVWNNEERKHFNKLKLSFGELTTNHFNHKISDTIVKGDLDLIDLGGGMVLKFGVEALKFDNLKSFKLVTLKAKTSKTFNSESIQELFPSYNPLLLQAGYFIAITVAVSVDISPEDFAKYNNLKKIENDINQIDKKVEKLKNELDVLNEKRLMSKSKFIEAGQKDTKSTIAKLEKQFNKKNKGLRDDILKIKKKLRKLKKETKSLTQKAKNILKKINSPFLKMLNRGLINKLGKLLTKLDAFLSFVEVIYFGLKIAILLWSGVKIKFLNGDSIDSMTMYELSELLMETMLDSITGKEIPKGDTSMNERPESVYSHLIDENAESSDVGDHVAIMKGKIDGYAKYAGLKTNSHGNNKDSNDNSTNNANANREKELKEVSEKNEKKQGGFRNGTTDELEIEDKTTGGDGGSLIKGEYEGSSKDGLKRTIVIPKDFIHGEEFDGVGYKNNIYGEVNGKTVGGRYTMDLIVVASKGNRVYEIRFGDVEVELIIREKTDGNGKKKTDQPVIIIKESIIAVGEKIKAVLKKGKVYDIIHLDGN